MTETQVEMQVVSAVSNLLANTPLEQAMYERLQRLGPPQFDDGRPRVRRRRSRRR